MEDFAKAQIYPVMNAKYPHEDYRIKYCDGEDGLHFTESMRQVIMAQGEIGQIIIDNYDTIQRFKEVIECDTGKYDKLYGGTAVMYFMNIIAPILEFGFVDPKHRVKIMCADSLLKPLRERGLKAYSGEYDFIEKTYMPLLHVYCSGKPTENKQKSVEAQLEDVNAAVSYLQAKIC